MIPPKNKGKPKSIYKDAILNSNKKYFNRIRFIYATKSFGGNSKNALEADKPEISFPYLAFIGTSFTTASV